MRGDGGVLAGKSPALPEARKSRVSMRISPPKKRRQPLRIASFRIFTSARRLLSSRPIRMKRGSSGGTSLNKTKPSEKTARDIIRPLSSFSNPTALGAIEEKTHLLGL